MQERRNKILTIVLLVLVAATLGFYFSGDSTDRLNVDRDLFAFEEPSLIDQVVFKTKDAQDIKLGYNGTRWMVNESLEADPQRIKVLFAIIKQVRIRRPVSNQLSDSLSQLLKDNATGVSFYQKGKPVHSVEVMGDESNGITYMTSSNDPTIYIVQIPGYRSYLAGLFTLDKNGWRDPLVFDINWRNMQSVKMIYPERNNDSFEINFDDNLYQIRQLQETDTTKLYNTLDDISRLFVDDYLNESEVKDYESARKDSIATIIVEDVGKNTFTLEIFGKVSGKNARMVRVDSVDFGLISNDKLFPVLRPKRYFEKKR